MISARFPQECRKYGRPFAWAMAAYRVCHGSVYRRSVSGGTSVAVLNPMSSPWNSGREPVEAEEMPVELLQQAADALGDRGDQLRIVGQREAQALVGHEMGEVLVDAAAVAHHQAHARREVRVEVLVREEVELLRPSATGSARNPPSS